ncbi:hypothetical protein [Streptomyces acidiscabies]|uniref:Uncharacterized protein n=1 Tax=Streptomyces acidiscabies TaxID=42234 RepID=A0ABU4LXJ9_9ACTN|nr:hypothetical protein [Streptomyces acidiscabies]MDX3019989.1 hypothetical protein [Streptomyces acidiscabies]
MTALGSARAATGVELLTLTLLVSSDQANWHTIVFEGEDPAYVDKQAAAWLKERPYLSVEMGDVTCYGQFPRTFNELFASITRDQQLVQVSML